MYGSKFAVFCLLFSSVAFAGINESFQHALNGRVKLSTEDIENMYEAFQLQYGHSEGKAPSQTFNDIIDRKSIFVYNVQEIINHNADES